MLDFKRRCDPFLRGLWALAVLSGALQVLPFPIAGPRSLWRTVSAGLRLFPFSRADGGRPHGRRARRVRDGAMLGYVSGVIWYLGNCYWIYQTMYLYGGIAKPAAAGILASVLSLSGPVSRVCLRLLVAACRHFRSRQEAGRERRSATESVCLGSRGICARTNHGLSVGPAWDYTGR